MQLLTPIANKCELIFLKRVITDAATIKRNMSKELLNPQTY